jgi:hypothetical protein
VTAETPHHPRLAPLPEPDPRTGARKRLLIAFVTALALTAVAGIGWLFVKPEERPPCCTASGEVTDAVTGIAYALPEGWEVYPEGQFMQDFTSGAGVGDSNSGAQVWSFPMEDWEGDPQAAGEAAAQAVTGYFYARVPDEWEFLASEPRSLGGTDAWEVSWLASDEFYEGPIYGRLLQVPAEDGTSSHFLFGFVYPDNEALRVEVDWIFTQAELLNS